MLAYFKQATGRDDMGKSNDTCTKSTEDLLHALQHYSANSGYTRTSCACITLQPAANVSAKITTHAHSASDVKLNFFLSSRIKFHA